MQIIPLLMTIMRFLSKNRKKKTGTRINLMMFFLSLADGPEDSFVPYCYSARSVPPVISSGAAGEVEKSVNLSRPRCSPGPGCDIGLLHPYPQRVPFYEVGYVASGRTGGRFCNRMSGTGMQDVGTCSNPEFAEQVHLPLTHLRGTSGCFARQIRRAKHHNMPQKPTGWG